MAAIATIVLSSSLLTTIVSWVKDRRKDAASTELTSVQALTSAMAALHDELSAAREEILQLREENFGLRKAIAALERAVEGR